MGANNGGPMQSTLHVLAVVGAISMTPAQAMAQATTLKVAVDPQNLPDTKGPQPDAQSQKDVALAAQALLQKIVTSQKFETAVKNEVANGGFDLGAANFKQRNRRVVEANKAQIWKVVSNGLDAIGQITHS